MSELQRDRAGALAEAGSSFGDRIRPAFASLPPSRFALWRDKSRRYGAASFACKHERRMVDQTGASWNQIAIWLRQLEGFREAV